MAYPKEYKPEQNYMYQILCRHPIYNGREWEHCDYAINKKDLIHLLDNYKMCYAGYEFKNILLPQKYWKK